MANFFDKVLREPGSAVPGPPKKPWWQTTRTARQGFILAALWATLGLAGGMVAHLWVMGVGWLVLGGVHLASAVALRRREQASRERGARPR